MDAVINIALIALLALFGIAGMVLSVLQLPGTWLIVAATAGYAWYYGGERISMTTVIWLVVIAGLAEIVELLSGYLAGKRGGASRRASWYGMFGGIAGALLLTVPVPIIGTIIGAAIGCFVGALVAELSQARGWQAGARSGMYTAVGRTMGSVFKTATAVVIAGWAVAAAIVP